MKKEKLTENSLRLLVFVIGIFSICILLLSFKLKVNAESVSTSLPYFVSNEDFVNSDGYTLDDLIDFYNGRWSAYPLDFSSGVFIYEYTENNYTWTSILVPDSSSSDYTITLNATYDSFDITSNSANVHLTGYSKIDFSNQPYFSSNYYTNPKLTRSSNVPRGIDVPLFYNGHLPLFANSQFFYSESEIVFGYDDAITIPTFSYGHAAEPSFDSDTIIDSGLHPNVLPSAPQYTTYNITTFQAPTIDTSSVENLLESIWDVISYTGQYIISNVGGFFNNIWNNISLAFGYIGDLLSYLFNKVLNTIKQSVHNLFENFRDLFEPVLNSLANMINIFNTLYTLGLKDGVFDIPTLFGALFVPNQSDLALLVDTFVEFDYLQTASISIKSLINGVFDVLNDDAVYSIHLQAFTFHGISVPEQEISFDWYLPYKATGDIFISAFLIVGYLYWLWTRISGIFHGAVPDSQGSSEITVDRSVSGVGGWFDY